jgi:hypothetical protein
MNFKIYWTQTGDEFQIDSIDEELTSWYVEQCMIWDSKFTSEVFSEDKKPTNVNGIIDLIRKNVIVVNKTLSKLKLSPLVLPNNFFDQFQINQLHKDWISLIRKHPKLETLLYKIDVKLFDSFHALNRQIHKLEESFCYRLRSRELRREINPFINRLFPTGVFNIELEYVDFGRSSFSKFVNFDPTPNDHELSQWMHIGENISINLVKPYQYEHPPEFITYCVTHSITPVTNKLPLGNLKDVDKTLTYAREVMNKNIILNNNYLRIIKI